MLQILRKKAQSTVIQIIVVIIALVFIFWGVGTNLNNSRQTALKVNGEEITFQQYQQAYDRALQQISDRFGGNVPKGLAETLGVKQQVINQLVQSALLRQGAAEMGIVVSNKEVRDTIQNMVQFQENGSFSIDRYKTILAANRMAPTKFETTMRYDRLSEVAAREIGRFAAITTDSEIQEIYSQLNEKVAVDYVKFAAQDFTDKVVIDDEKLAAWFETVKDNYKTEPQIKLNYLSYTFADVGSKIEIDDAAVQEYYQANIENYTIPEKRQARHILFKASDEDTPEVHADKKKQAGDVLQLAKSGKDFAALARQYSEGPSKANGGELGYFSRDQMVGPFADAVFTMQPGDISDVVKTRFGYHLILLEKIEPTHTKTVAEVHDEIVKALQEKQAESLAFQIANEAYEAIIASGSLAAYSEKHSEAKIHETDFFTKNTAPAGIKDDSEFLDKAFSLQKGELSSLVKGTTGYAIFFVDDLKEPVIPPMSDVKDKVTADYRQAQSKELAKAAAEKLLDEARAGKGLEETANEQGVEIKDSGLLSKNSQQASATTFPQELTEAVFKLSNTVKLPEKVGEIGTEFYVYSFKNREIPTMPTDKNEIERYRQNLLRFKQQQLLAGWLRHMEAGAKVTKHESL